MAEVTVNPMPEDVRNASPRFRRMPPPVFSGEPTEEDVELARALFQALDPESQLWYRRCSVFADLLPEAREESAHKRRV